MIQPTCKNCQFWNRDTDSVRPERPGGECRILPPERQGNNRGPFPRTYFEDWCGSHHRKTYRAQRVKTDRPRAGEGFDDSAMYEFLDKVAELFLGGGRKPE